MPQTGDFCERGGVHVDEHGCEANIAEGQAFPPCSGGPTWWWHESLPAATHIRWELARKAEKQRQGKLYNPPTKERKW